MLRRFAALRPVALTRAALLACAALIAAPLALPATAQPRPAARPAARPAPPAARPPVARPAVRVAADGRPHNVIYFITDGFGPASVTFARDYANATEGRRQLTFDPYVTGTVQTWATDSRVTDSAAGGTALAAGVKTYNGAIGVDTMGMAVASVLEGARGRGMATGVVVTSRFTHATPASFTAHVGSRAMEDEIARQQVTLAPDVMMGGGRRHFLPADAPGGRRRDGQHLLDTLRAKGFTVATDRAGFDAARRAPFAAFFTDDHMAYEVDRDAAREPSLAEMTARAIEMLDARARTLPRRTDGGPPGFFLMVEASRIDHAGHANDAAGHLHDILAFEQAWTVALDYARRSGSTLVLSTSDHETGGLALARNVDGRGIYAWHPETLVRRRASNDVLMPALAAAQRADTSGGAALAVLRETMGLDDLTGAEIAEVHAALRTPSGRTAIVVNELTSRRALIAWTTNGHTAVDVNLYAFGVGSAPLRGHMDNAAVGRAVADALRLDLATLTRELRLRIARQPRGPGE